MKHFLFLHGSWHGAWCWHKILPRIQAAGHEASAIDLPGRGRAAALPALVGLERMVSAAEAALARYGRVPRAYIRLTQDNAVSLRLQDRLLEETPVDRLESLHASHSAYFSQPDALSQAILRLAN